MEVRIIEAGGIEEVAKYVRMTGADPYSVPIMASKGLINTVLIEGIDNRAANIIKQEMLSLGGEAAVSRDVGAFKKGKSDVLLICTAKQREKFLEKLSCQPFGLKNLGAKLRDAVRAYARDSFTVTLKSKKLVLDSNCPAVMGILNVTPDSFFDGGKYLTAENAVAHGVEMEDAGARIIDVGGESSRPGARRVSAHEEIKRVLPVLKALRKKVKALISIDTYKPEVAAACLNEGADIINDITGLRYSKGTMAGVAARSGAPVIIMHMRGNPGNMQKSPAYDDVVRDTIGFFSGRISFCLDMGLNKDRLIIDPGIGFGKTTEHNLEILKRLKEYKNLGLPVAIGLSRKSFIGQILGETNVSARLAGSITGAVWSALNGAHIIRAHDVRETVQSIKLIKAINRINM